MNWQLGDKVDMSKVPEREDNAIAGDLITYLEFARLALSMRHVNGLGEITDLSDAELYRLEEQLNEFLAKA